MTQTEMQPAETAIVKPAPAAPAPAATLSPHVLQFLPPALIVASEPAARQGLAYLAKQYADGGFLPEGLTPQGAIVLMVAGVDYNLSPIEAISKLYLIGGRVVPSAHELVAQALRRGVKIEVLESTMEKAHIRLSRDGHADFEYEYAKEHAQKAQLWGKKGPWSNDPRSMLMARCKAQALRIFAPDTLSSLYTDEEVASGRGDVVDGVFTPDPDITGDQPKEAVKAFEDATPRGAVTQEKKASSKKAKTEEKKPDPEPTPPPTPPAPPEPEGPSEPRGEMKVQPTPAPEPVVEAPQLPEVKSGSFLAQVMFAAKVPGSETRSPDGQMVSRLDSGKVSRMVLAHMEQRFPKEMAIGMLKTKVKGFGAETSADLSLLQLMQLVGWADEQVKAAPAPAEPVIAPFNPNLGRGAATKPGGPVEDGAAVDYDAEILNLFELLSGEGRDHEANEVFEETGYGEEAENSIPQVKAETLSKLRALKDKAA